MFGGRATRLSLLRAERLDRYVPPSTERLSNRRASGFGCPRVRHMGGESVPALLFGSQVSRCGALDRDLLCRKRGPHLGAWLQENADALHPGSVGSRLFAVRRLLPEAHGYRELSIRGPVWVWIAGLLMLLAALGAGAYLAGRAAAPERAGSRRAARVRAERAAYVLGRTKGVQRGQASGRRSGRLKGLEAGGRDGAAEGGR